MEKPTRAAKESVEFTAACRLGAVASFAALVPFHGRLALHTLVYPEHIGHFKEFWGSGVSGRAFISTFLLVMPLFVPAITLSLLISNLVMWLIPPARRAMNAEAAGDPEMTFRGANLGLIKFGGVASAVAFVLTLIGALTLSSLR
jgi:hypothetical protein